MRKYRAVFLILTSSHSDTQFANLKRDLLNEENSNDFHARYGEMLDSENLQVDMCFESRLTLKKASPFSRFFADAVKSESKDSDITKDLENAENTINELYSPSCMRVISDLIPYFPMWSCVMHNTETSQVHSNATVESHFRNLKHSTLEKRKLLRPGEIVRKELTFVRAKLNAKLLPGGSVTCKKRKFTKEIADEEETFKRKRKEKGYGNKANAKKRLFTTIQQRTDVVQSG